MDLIGRQISKRLPSSRTLVNQGYNIEKNRVIILNRAHAVQIELRRARGDVRITFAIGCSNVDRLFNWSDPHLGLESVVVATFEPTKAMSHCLQPQAHRLQLQAHRRLQLLTHPRRRQRGAAPPSPLPIEFEQLVKGLPPHLADAYTINPQMLTSANEHSWPT